jgi:hypothetical protein
MDTAQVTTGTAPVNPGPSDKEALAVDLWCLAFEADCVSDAISSLRDQLDVDPQGLGPLIDELRAQIEHCLLVALEDVADRLGITD